LNHGAGVRRVGEVSADDPDAPFFAYGIFRSDEIAFPTIANCVEAITPATVCGRLLERDGLHLLDLGGDDEVPGELLRFREAGRGAA
jgi:hypothetical protein